MPFRPPEIVVPEDDPFVNDVLGREASARVLTQLISTLDQSFVLAIDSPWGTGKTTFLRMWLQSLRKEGCACLHFNAWETDFVEDPLVSLIGELSERSSGSSTS